MQRKIERILVTGGAGFIGSAFIRFALPLCQKIVNLDLLTYAGNLRLLEDLANHPSYRFVQGDINDQPLVESLLKEEGLDAIVHFAAETHVDRSIASARPFLEANVLGTVALLEALRKFPSIHFHHVSTDEVYGSLGESGVFCEESLYCPNSPYSASKAASDHFVRAFAHTYGLSTTLSHCSNNFGAGQFSEKFIPKTLSQCLAGEPLSIYGTGKNVRDWLYVDDHLEAIWAILHKGERGESYNIGGGSELSNLAMAHRLMDLLAEQTGVGIETYRSLIRFVSDRPGHDFRYAIDASKIEKTLGWRPRVGLDEGLRETIRFYIDFFKDQSAIGLNSCNVPSDKVSSVGETGKYSTELHEFKPIADQSIACFAKRTNPAL